MSVVESKLDIEVVHYLKQFKDYSNTWNDANAGNVYKAQSPIPKQNDINDPNMQSESNDNNNSAPR